jgi:hypothetical protein
MRKTIPSYTIFTCDCCGREQDDEEHQMSIHDAPSAASFGQGIESTVFQYTIPSMGHFSYDMCHECSTRIHDAIQDVRRRASSETMCESLAMTTERKDHP